MAKNLQLELVYPSGTVTFAVEGSYLPRWEPTYRFNVNPPEVVELRQVWEFQQVKFISTTVSGLWTTAGNINTLLSILATRGTGHFTSARLIADPSGTPTTLITLGPSDYEKFAVEALEGELDAVTPRASWNKSAAFTLRVSAVRKFEDAQGIVDFQQTVRITFPRGLERVEAVTTITTKEGTSAVTKAASYAALDSTNYGSDYLYETGIDADGIDYEYEDADLVNGRTPTLCRATSIIQQQGVDVGTTGPSGSLAEAFYQTTVETTAKEVITRYVAQAVGANASAWVLSRKPSGSLSRDVLVTEPSGLLVRGEWEIKTQRTTSSGAETSMVVEVEITGGGPDIDFEPTVGGFEPVMFEGGVLPWVARVSVSVERTGGSGRHSELRLPGPPGEPWIFIPNESTEKDPYRVEAEKGTDEAQDKWKREAVLVFKAPRAPDEPVSLAMARAQPVASYRYPGQLT